MWWCSRYILQQIASIFAQFKVYPWRLILVSCELPIHGGQNLVQCPYYISVRKRRQRFQTSVKWSLISVREILMDFCVSFSIVNVSSFCCFGSCSWHRPSQAHLFPLTRTLVSFNELWLPAPVGRSWRLTKTSTWTAGRWRRCARSINF